MPRSLTDAALASLYGDSTGLVWLVLLSIRTEDDVVLDESKNEVLDESGEPVQPEGSAFTRLVNNTEDIVSRGNTYTAFPFEVPIPSEREDEPPQVDLVTANVDRTLSDLLQGIGPRPKVRMEIVTTNDADTVEVGPIEFDMADYRFDAQTFSAQLTFEPILHEPIPSQRFTPANTPGLF